MLRKSGLAAAAAAASAAVAIGIPLAMAAPTAVPPSDTGGYLDSTARCIAPDTAVLFGTTKTSRVAICKTASGYEYRGVRVSDGAKLIATAKQTSSNTYVVDNDGVTYTLTPTALSVTANGDTFRTETWTDYHGPQAPATSPSKPSGSATPAPASTSGTAAPKTSSPGTPSASAAPTTSPAPKAAATPSSAAPLPPPMAAEVGGAPSAG